MGDTPQIIHYWNISSDQVLNELHTASEGLNKEEVSKRQKEFGLNTIHTRKISILSILIRQFTGNPLIIILGVATFISYLLGQQISSYYIFGLILVSVFLGLWNEYSAVKTVESLLKKISHNAVVMRNGVKEEITLPQLTIGDIVFLSPGSIVPADIRLTEAKDLEIDQSILTGESETVVKNTDVVKDDMPMADRSNISYMGTSVQSGSGTGVVIGIGKETEFGKIAKSSTYIKPVTEFQKGLERFGELIIKVILILTVAMFIINALLGHNILDSVLFSLAIAVGLTPELLPVIVTVSLAHGAGKLAKKHVVAKQLISIENLGNMDVLCTDKTGTLTEGKIQVVDYINISGEKDVRLITLSLWCNSAIVHHKIFGNGIDVALWEYAIHKNISLNKSTKKIDEEPFDYTRKAMYTIITDTQGTTLIAKGAPDSVLSYCKPFKTRVAVEKKFKSLNNNGFRVIVIATKKISKQHTYSWKDVEGLSFEGYISFLDTPKLTAKEALIHLHSLNVLTKVITGDNELVAKKICTEVGINTDIILLGREIDTLSDIQLKKSVEKTSIFARVNPEQKLRIIRTLQSNGHTVGYMGDGINDIPSLHGADVGISVDSAVDVAKDAAAIVLLRKSLNVIADGIDEGRRTFNNTVKYVLMATSSNFGNMFSAAGASFFLPFLPMTPLQILLTNGLYDISQMSIPTDNVDKESLIRPRHWNIKFIKSYMIFFGPLSSIFDYAIFGVMIYIFHAKGAIFQTGWFIESVITEIFVVFVIRTARTPFFLSKPSKWLTITCLCMVCIGILLPFSPLAVTLGFVAPPPLYFGILIVLTLAYLILVETVKNLFLKHYTL